MKKIITAIIMIIVSIGLLGTCVFADTSSDDKKEEIKFRDYDWGTSIDEIREKEITPSMVENKDYAFIDNQLIIADQRIAGYKCAMLFRVNDNDELIGGQYILDETHSNEQQYYNDFMDLVEKLTSIYGKDNLPTHELWLDDTYKDRPNKQGMAIITGDLQIGYQWSDSKGNTVSAMLHGDNYDCTTFILYQSKESSETTTDNLSGL